MMTTTKDQLRELLGNIGIEFETEKEPFDRKKTSTSKIFPEISEIINAAKRKLKEEYEIKLTNAEMIAIAVILTFGDGNIPEQILKKVSLLRDIKRKNPTKREFSDLLFVAEAIRQKLIRDLPPDVLTEWINELSKTEDVIYKFKQSVVKDKILSSLRYLGDTEIITLLNVSADMLTKKEIEKADYEQIEDNAMKYLKYKDMIDEMQHYIDIGIDVQRAKEGKDLIPGVKKE